MGAYYNEIDPFAAQWLRNLIAAGHIAPGDVDERSIEDVKADDLRGYTQCHFFAGIGVWSYALRRAGWPDDRPVWSASCPCQPFSAAGKGAGFADERHLWPAVDFLVGECRPSVLFGEQVASKDGLAWLDTVQADLEGKGYAIGALDLCAASVGAPHIRQRLYFVAHAMPAGRPQGRPESGCRSTAGGCGTGDMGYPDHAGSQGRFERRLGAHQQLAWPAGMACDLADADFRGREKSDLYLRPARQVEATALERGASHWSTADWIPCADGAWRPVEPGTFPLAHGAPARVGRLRGYGNAIVAPLAEEFIKAYLAG